MKKNMYSHKYKVKNNGQNVLKGYIDKDKLSTKGKESGGDLRSRKSGGTKAKR